VKKHEVIAVCGAKGKTGSAVTKFLVEQGLEVVEVDPKLNVNLKEVISKVNCVVDFTTPEAVLENINICIENGKDMVIGTTGWDLKILDLLNLKESQAIFVAPNFSIGANLMMIFSKMASNFFEHWHIVEAHHINKKDKPSGTAKFTSEMIAGEIKSEQISSIRLPGLVAHQSVIFSSNGEVLNITHHSMSRSSFGYGVKLAIEWCAKNSGIKVGLDSLIKELLF